MTSFHRLSAFPNLANRLRAALIDGVVVPFSALTVLFVSDAYSHNNILKISGAILVILLLEPFAVSMFGGTVGHHLTGMRVRKRNTDQRLNLISATGRFIVKTLLGLPSFMVIVLTGNRQAIHDMLFGSVVVFKNNGALPDQQTLNNISTQFEQHNSQSVLRRIGLVIIYWIIAYLFYSLILTLFFTPCIVDRRCSPTQNISVLGLSLLFLLALIAIPILSWKGKLYGARKHLNNEAEPKQRIEPQ